MEKQWQDIPDEIWQELWDKAVPLQAALSAFSGERTRTHYRRLKAVGGPKAFNRNLSRLVKRTNSKEASDEDPPIDDFMTSLGQLDPTRKAEFTALKNKLQAQLHGWFKAGTLIALGFSEPRRPMDAPYPVPKDALYGFINWDDHRIQHGTLKVEQVRVAPADWLSGLIEESGSSEETRSSGSSGKSGKSGSDHADNTRRNSSAGDDVRRTPGRPSRGDEIIEAYEVLLQDGTLRPDDPMTKQADEIRSYLKSHYDDPSSYQDGLGYQTIRRALIAYVQNSI